MGDSESILKYYRDELKWNPPFAEIFSKYSPNALSGYLGIDNCQDTCRIKKFVRYFDNLFHNFCSIRSAY